MSVLVAATLIGRLAIRAVSHGRAFTTGRLSRPTRARAPWMSRVRKYRSPALVILPIFSLPPLARTLGVRPSQAAKCLAEANCLPSPTEATSAVAVIGPMPGAVANLRMTSLCPC